MGVGSVDVPLSPIKESMFLKQQHRVLHRGTTLIELVVAITLMALVMGTVVPLIGSLRNNLDSAQSNMNTLQKGRSLFNHLSLHLGQAIRITAVSPASQTLGYIEFEDDLGDAYRYDVGADSYVEYGLAASQENLAGPVSQLQFTCYSHHDMNSPITDVNSIRFVEVQATIINQGTTGQDKTFSTSAYVYVNGNNNESEATMGTPFEFDPVDGRTPALAQIDATHYLCAYQGVGGDGWAVVLSVNNGNWSVSQGTAFEFETVEGKDPHLTQIDSTHYLCAYSGSGGDGYAVVLTVNTGDWSISKGSSLEHNTTEGREPALAQIDSTHYLCTYRGPSGDGFAVVLIASNGLVGHWKLDESSGFTAADASGNGNHGALANMAGNEWTTGIADGALEFDGADDHILVPAATSLSLVNEFTVAAWIYAHASGLNLYDMILSKGGLTSSNYWFGTVDDEIAFGFYLSDFHEFNSASANLQTETWYHIAATLDLNSSSVNVYLNGTPIGNWSNALQPLANAEDLRMGRSEYADGQYWDGILDDVRVYDRALSATEIASLASTLSYEGGTETKAGTDTTSVTVSTPPATSAGDLLVAAVATDGDTSLTLAPPGGQGWTQVSLNDYINEVTLGAWWKLAGASEPGTHQFTWSGAEQAYAWIMRFTGHDPADPVDVFSTNSANSSSPSSPAVTTAVDNALVLRLGAFDCDDITEDAPGLTGHTAITMDASAASAPQVTFEAFTETKRSTKGTSVTLNTPSGTSAGDLLIAAVSTASDTEASLAPDLPQQLQHRDPRGLVEARRGLGSRDPCIHLVRQAEGICLDDALYRP